MKRITLLSVVAQVLLAILLFLGATMYMLDRRTVQWQRADNLSEQAKLADSELDRRVLLVRAGLLRDYDVLATEQTRLQRLLDQLADAYRRDPELARLAARLDETYAAKEEQIEEFKSGYSLLVNSLNYFWRASMDKGEQGAPTNDPDVRTMIGAVQRLTLDTSADAVAEARRRLDTVAGRHARQSASTRVLIDHGQVLIETLPSIDAILAGLRPLSSTAQFQSMLAAIHARETETARHSSLVGNALLLLSLVMLVLVVCLAVLYRKRAQLLRRRKQLDRIMIGFSGRLAASSHSSLDADIDAAISQIAAWSGASRGWMLLSRGAGPLCTWPADMDAHTRGKLLGLLESGDARHRGDTDLIELAAAAPMAGGDPAALLVAIPRRNGAAIDALLCLELPGQARRLLRSGLNQLCTALGVLSGAVERRLLEESGRRLERKLEQARRMEAVGAMASGISHNFNNIIGAVQGNAEAAYAALPAGSSAAGNLLEIGRAATRARDLVNNILGIGRSGPPDARELAIADLVAETISLVHASFGRSLSIQVADNCPGAMAAGNLADLQQVLMNIITNAGHAQQWQGSVEVQVDGHHAGEGADESGAGPAALPGASLCISVRDHGPGIPPQIIDRIFEPFFTTRRHGTGLGLASARQIMANHGGRLEADNLPGGGAVFRILLPLSGCAPPPSRGHTLLVVGPDAQRAARNEDILAALGYEPVGAGDLDAAARIASSDPARFDGVLIDLPLAPQATRCAQLLHEAMPGVPMVLSCSAETLDTALLAGYGVVDVIASPPRAAELAQAIARSLAAREWRRRPAAVNVTNETQPPAAETIG